MSTPPLLLGLAVLFWSQQTGLLALGAALAAGLEGSRLLAKRWEIAAADQNRIADFCTVAFAALVIYLYSVRGPVAAISSIVQWLPIVLAPLALAQAYSAAGRLDLGAFILSLRGGDAPRRAIDISHPFAALCVLAAGAANARTPAYYLATAALAGWALWARRPPGPSAAAWLATFAAACALGYAGHHGLNRLQGVVEGATTWLVMDARVDSDPFQNHTAIGRIGTLKQSHEIELRVSAAAGQPAPPLLRVAVYDKYKDAHWYATEARFKPAEPGRDEQSWRWAPDSGPDRTATVSGALRGGRGLLALPAGAQGVRGVPAAGVARNRLGAVSVREGPGWLSYEVGFNQNATHESAPAPEDLDFRGLEADSLRRLARELKLSAARPRESMAALRALFAQRFTYSLVQTSAAKRPVEEFMLHRRSGHCEHFATATVLLLRAGGIPARYATGWSVQEYSALEAAHLVRQRHAHAWAAVFVDGAWRDFDTTPPGWAQSEAGAPSLRRALADRLSWASHHWSRWRWRKSAGGGKGALVAVLLAVLAVIGLRQLRGFSASARARANAAAKPAREPLQGEDSELYELERRLTRSGAGRRPEETMAAWARRVDARLVPLALLHEKHRFARGALSSDERAALAALARDWRD